MAVAARLLFSLFFEDRDDLMECVKFTFTPDILSMFRGEYWEDARQSLKFAGYLFVIGLCGMGTYIGIASLGV